MRTNEQLRSCIDTLHLAKESVPGKRDKSILEAQIKILNWAMCDNNEP